MIKLCILYISYKIRRVKYNNEHSYDPYYIRVRSVFLYSIYDKYLTQLLALAHSYQSSKYDKPSGYFIIL